MLKEFQTASPNLSVAVWLEDHPGVTTVRYPDLESHPQFDLAKRQMESGGTGVTLEVPGGTSGAFAVLNALELIDISNNLGDTMSLITHPATTTHRRLGLRLPPDWGRLV